MLVAELKNTPILLHPHQRLTPTIGTTNI